MKQARFRTSIRQLGLVVAAILCLTLFACARAPREARPIKTSETKTEKSRLLTKDQQKIIDTFGRPKQFILAYTPIGGDDGFGLSRTEIWYYPRHRKKITFAAGDILNVKAMEGPSKGVSYSGARIEKFDFSMDYEGVIKALGIEKAEPIEFADNIFKEDAVESYLADKVTFTIEQGHLTYLQTLGARE